MPKAHEWLHEELESLRQIRDEVRVQANLGRADLRDRFQALEKRWDELEGRLKLVREGAREDLGEVKKAAKTLVDEMRESYRKLRSRL
jgi:predicted nuclease with TOPRIM domain